MSNKFDQYFTSLAGKHIAVIGLGVSNRPLVRLLLENGSIVTGCDRTPREKLDDEVLELEKLGCKLKTGDDYLTDIQAEMVSADYVLFMTSVADSEEFYRRFLDALIEIDGTLEENKNLGSSKEDLGKRKSLMRICEAIEKKKKALPLMESMGEICGTYVYIYPPGIPLLTPGEKISERCVRSLLFYLEEGLKVHGLTKEREIEVVWEEFFT